MSKKLNCAKNKLPRSSKRNNSGNKNKLRKPRQQLWQVEILMQQLCFLLHKLKVELFLKEKTLKMRTNLMQKVLKVSIDTTRCLSLCWRVLKYLTVQLLNKIMEDIKLRTQELKKLNRLLRLTLLKKDQRLKKSLLIWTTNSTIQMMILLMMMTQKNKTKIFLGQI